MSYTLIFFIRNSHEVSQKELKLMLKPWITQEVLKKCDQRDELLKKYKNEKKNPVIASQIYKD